MGLEARNTHEYHCKVNSLEAKNCLKRKAESCQVWITKMSKTLQNKYHLPKELSGKDTMANIGRKYPIFMDKVDDPTVRHAKSGQEDKDCTFTNGTKSDLKANLRTSRSVQKLTDANQFPCCTERTPNVTNKKFAGRNNVTNGKQNCSKNKYYYCTKSSNRLRQKAAKCSRSGRKLTFTSILKDFWAKKTKNSK